MSSQPVNRKNDLKLGDINSDVILYRMPINEFFKLIYNDPTSNVTFEDRLLVKDSFEKLNNQFVNVCHVEASLEDELAPFKNIKKIKDRDELVKKYFKSKNGQENITVGEVGKGINKEFAIYYETPLVKFRNNIILDNLICSTSDPFDFLTRLANVMDFSDNVSREIIYNLVQDEMYNMMDNSEYSSNFSIDLLENNFKCTKKFKKEFNEDEIILKEILEFERPELE